MQGAHGLILLPGSREEYRLSKMLKSYVLVGARVCASLVVAAIIVSTLSPLALRPHEGNVLFEHFGAFLVCGTLLGLSFPRRLLPVTLTLAAGAIALELAQMLTPDRHARLLDVVEKLAGGAVGIAVAYYVGRVVWGRDVPRTNRKGPLE